MKKLLVIISLLISLSLLSACHSEQSNPTPDINQLATQAVQTFAAQLTMTQAALPTLTLVPSATTTQTPTRAASSTLDIVLPTYSPGIEDKAILLSQSPIDYAELGIKQKFDVLFVVKNDGQTTWSRQYKLRYFSGWAIAETTEAFFPKEIKPGEEVRLVLDAIAPPYIGSYVTNWKLTNADGQNFYDLYLNVVVVSGNTSTPTETATSTPEE